METIQGSLSSSHRVGVVAANHTGYVEALFNCLESGAIAIPLRSEDDPRIQVAQVSQVVRLASGQAWMHRAFHPVQSRAAALIAFTSGTEGEPKGVVLTHHNLADVVQRLNQVMTVDDSICEYVGVPVYHSFGFGRCRAVATAGGRFFIPSNGFNPAEIAEMLRRGEINAISAVPSLWRVLLANSDLIGELGQRVRWIEIGSQYMSRGEKESLKAIFPAARIVQHYGLTEASRTTLLEIHGETGEQLESVGRVVGNVAVQITPDGRIAIRGSHVAAHYLIGGKEVPLVDQDGWFVTQDLGHMQEGYLYYKGRADDVINCGGIKVSPEALEAKVYAQIGYSSGLAICRKPDPLRGHGFLVAVTPELILPKPALREAVLAALQELGVNAGNAIAIVEVDQLPRTASGKVQRSKLSEQHAQMQESGQLDISGKPIEDNEQPNSQTLSQLGKVEAIFCRGFNLQTVRPQDTFVTLGGDSLSYVQLSIQLERCLGHLPQKWEEIPIRELSAYQSRNLANRPRSTSIETNILFRAIAIAGVVANHTGLLTGNWVQSGTGISLLLMISGLNFARFQGNTLRSGRFLKPVASLLRNLLIPYWFLAISYQIWKQEFVPSILFLYSNFIDPNIGSIFPVWFIMGLVQCIILFTLTFSFQFVRNWAKAFAWRFGIVYVSITALISKLISLVWNTQHLYDRVPNTLMWIFALGWCIHFAHTKAQKWITTIATAVMIFFLTRVESGEILLLVGGLAILWYPYCYLPKWLKLPVQSVGGAAYDIYLTHIIFMTILRAMGVQAPLISWVVEMAGGVSIWWGRQRLQQVSSRLYSCFSNRFDNR